MGKKKSNKTKTIKNNETKSKKLIGNIIFAIYSLLLIICCIPSSIYYFTAINLALMLFFALTGIFLLLKTKIGLICAYIMNGVCALLGFLVTCAGIFEMIVDKDQSIILNNVQGIAWVMVLAVAVMIWSVVYLIYYIKKRKYFTNANLD